MTLRLRDTTPVLGGIERIWVDDDGDTVVDEFIQDCDPILDMNKRFQCGDKPRVGLTEATGFRKVASIPLVIAEKWRREHGIDVMKTEHWPRVERLLNDPDWRYLKTTAGCV